ncbi:MAG: potassium-transporting ATPase subunit KdpC [Microbacteriaceae bacterium]|nr:potassium-transporting ATPase subunit KdpC [Microbacteriaceae bacterium]
MNASTRSAGRTLWVSVRAMAVFTAIVIVYTLVVTGVGQLALPWQANGSPVQNAQGETVGSALLGQGFLDADGAPLPEYFQSRPSAEGWTGTNSYGSNRGPEHPDLVASIEAARAQVAEFNGVAPEAVPVDAVTASGSGLDPHISPAYAAIQVARVAEARGLDLAQVEALVAQHTNGRDLGFLGDPVVNVLQLNLALDELKG